MRKWINLELVGILGILVTLWVGWRNLGGDIALLRSEMESRFQRMEQRFEDLDSRLAGLGQRVVELERSSQIFFQTGIGPPPRVSQ